MHRRKELGKMKKLLMGILITAVTLCLGSNTYATSRTSQAGISFTGDGSIEVSVTLQKQDKDTKALLSGAAFELRDESGQNVAVDETLTTDDKGEIHLDRLQPGKYTFVEIKSPEGYQLDTTPIPFEVSFDQTEATVIAYNQKITNSSGSTQQNTNSSGSTKQSEKPKKQGFLPSTGMKDGTVYVFLGIIILIGALYLWYRHQKMK